MAGTMQQRSGFAGMMLFTLVAVALVLAGHACTGGRPHGAGGEGRSVRLIDYVGEPERPARYFRPR